MRPEISVLVDRTGVERGGLVVAVRAAEIHVIEGRAEAIFRGRLIVELSERDILIGQCEAGDRSCVLMTPTAAVH